MMGIFFGRLSDDGFVTSKYKSIFSSISGFDVWLKLLTSSKMELFGLVFIMYSQITYYNLTHSRHFMMGNFIYE